MIINVPFWASKTDTLFQGKPVTNPTTACFVDIWLLWSSWGLALWSCLCEGFRFPPWSWSCFVDSWRIFFLCNFRKQISSSTVLSICMTILQIRQLGCVAANSRVAIWCLSCQTKTVQWPLFIKRSKPHYGKDVRLHPIWDIYFSTVAPSRNTTPTYSYWTDVSYPNLIKSHQPLTVVHIRF